MQEIPQERVQFLRESKNFVKPILQMIQDNGGELSNYSQIDKLITQYLDLTDEDLNYYKISNKGNRYVPYHFGRNFAIKNLELAGFLTHQKNSPIILTQKGLDANVPALDIEEDIYRLAYPYWNKKSEEAKARRLSQTNERPDDSDNESDINIQDDQEWRDLILDKVKQLDPFKFESFCRGLLNKMGFEIDTIKGISKSGDNGIDGFAYCLDDQSLKTTRVAIQCKKFTNNPVGSPDINNLRGAIDTTRAEYGIFITTSYFSSEAIRSSREGSTPITLIDGQELVNLMVKYKYKIREVPAYLPDDSYFNS